MDNGRLSGGLPAMVEPRPHFASPARGHVVVFLAGLGKEKILAMKSRCCTQACSTDS
jgi:hypothetical protein